MHTPSYFNPLHFAHTSPLGAQAVGGGDLNVCLSCNRLSVELSLASGHMHTYEPFSSIFSPRVTHFTAESLPISRGFSCSAMACSTLMVLPAQPLSLA